MEKKDSQGVCLKSRCCVRTVEWSILVSIFEDKSSFTEMLSGKTLVKIESVRSMVCSSYILQDLKTLADTKIKVFGCAVQQVIALQHGRAHVEIRSVEQ